MSEQIYEKFEKFPWDTDTAFQNGLKSILEGVPKEQREQNKDALIIQAKAFYFSKKEQVNLDLSGYNEWLKNKTSSTADKTNTSNSKPPYSLNYQQLVELISSGQPIPGIQNVPNIVLKNASAPSEAKPRKKPWEIKAEQEAKKQAEEVEKETKNQADESEQDAENKE